MRVRTVQTLFVGLLPSLMESEANSLAAQATYLPKPPTCPPPFPVAASHCHLLWMLWGFSVLSPIYSTGNLCLAGSSVNSISKMYPISPNLNVSFLYLPPLSFPNPLEISCLPLPQPLTGLRVMI